MNCPAKMELIDVFALVVVQSDIGDRHSLPRGAPCQNYEPINSTFVYRHDSYLVSAFVRSPAE